MVRRPPDLLEELALADQLAGVADQHVEQLPLDGGQVHGGAVGGVYLAAGDVDGVLAEVDGEWGVGGGEAAGGGADAGGGFLDAEGVGDGVVGGGVQSVD